jgi:hypothetical protein
LSRLESELKLQPEPELEPTPQYDDELVDGDFDTEIAEEMTSRADAPGQEPSDDEHEGNLHRFLVQARLRHYEKKLSALGAATTDDLFELGTEDLEEIGMRKLERSRLARFLQRYVMARPRLQEEGREVPDSLFNALALPPGEKPRRLVHGWVLRVAELRQRIVVVAWRSWIQHERLAQDLSRAKAAEIAAVQSRAVLLSRCDQVAATGSANEALTLLRDEHWVAEAIEAAAGAAEQAAVTLALPLPQAVEAMRLTHEKESGNQQQQISDASACDAADPSEAQ